MDREHVILEGEFDYQYPSARKPKPYYVRCAKCEGADAEGSMPAKYFLRFFEKKTDKCAVEELTVDFRSTDFCGIEVGFFKNKRTKFKDRFRDFFFKEVSYVYLRIFFTRRKTMQLQITNAKDQQVWNAFETIEMWRKKLTAELNYCCNWKMYIPARSDLNWSEGYGQLHLTKLQLTVVSTETDPVTLGYWALVNASECSSNSEMVSIKFTDLERPLVFETPIAIEIAKEVTSLMTSIITVNNLLPKPSSTIPSRSASRSVKRLNQLVPLPPVDTKSHTKESPPIPTIGNFITKIHQYALNTRNLHAIEDGKSHEKCESKLKPVPKPRSQNTPSPSPINFQGRQPESTGEFVVQQILPTPLSHYMSAPDFSKHPLPPNENPPRQFPCAVQDCSPRTPTPTQTSTPTWTGQRKPCPSPRNVFFPKYENRLSKSLENGMDFLNTTASMDERSTSMDFYSTIGDRRERSVSDYDEDEVYDFTNILDNLNKNNGSFRVSTMYYVNYLSGSAPEEPPPLPPRRHPAIPQASAEYSSAMNICNTLHKVLKRSPPNPDTLLLSIEKRREVCFHLYMNNLGTQDWRDLAAIIGLEYQAVELIEAFTVRHREETAGEVVLRHWQFRYNRYGHNAERCQRKCEKKDFIDILDEMDRKDIVKIIKDN